MLVQLARNISSVQDWLSPLFGKKEKWAFAYTEKSESAVIGSDNMACMVRICFECAASELFIN